MNRLRQSKLDTGDSFSHRAFYYFLIISIYFSTGAEDSSIQAPLGDSPIQKIVVNKDFVKDNLTEIFKDTELLHVNLDVRCYFRWQQ